MMLGAIARYYKTKGLSHSVNIYLMLDFPFKSDPRFSAALGLGIGSSNIKFDNQEPNIIGTGSTLAFPIKQIPPILKN